MTDDSIQSDSGPEFQATEKITAAQQIKVRPEPRISAKQLAEYLISDQSKQTTIIRDAKFAKTAIVVQYKKARSAIPHAFTVNCLDINELSRRADEIEREDTQNEWVQKDNARSAAALRLICQMGQHLNWKDAQRVHIREKYLNIGGVIVSVCPELTFSFVHQNAKKCGGLILNTTQNDDRTMARKSGNKYRMGDYLATLLFKLLLENAAKIGAPLNKKCMAVDIFRKEFYTAPASFQRLNRNIEDACGFIAARWPTIKQKTHSSMPSKS